MSTEQIQIPRYNLIIADDFSGTSDGRWIERVPYALGDYCMWEDVEAAIRELQEANTALRYAIEQVEEENATLYTRIRDLEEDLRWEQGNK